MRGEPVNSGAPSNFLSLPYRVRCSPLARRHADSTSSTFHPLFEYMRLRLSIQHPRPVFLTFFLREDDAKDDVHRCNLAPEPAFLQRKRQHKHVSRRPHNVDAGLIRVQIFSSLQ